jgi:DNA polymerase III epsilon subunit family exonuclease
MQIIPFQDLVRRYFSGESFVLFDTETGGLNTFHDDIIEVGAITWQRGQEPKTFQELMCVNVNKISEGAWKIHQIPKEEILAARPPKEVLSDFINFCEAKTLVAHNVKFDYDILNSNLIRHGMKPYQNDWVADSLTYAKEQMKPGRLLDLASHYKITTKNSKLHRALYDVHVLKEVLDHMMKENEPTEMQYSLIL